MIPTIIIIFGSIVLYAGYITERRYHERTKGYLKDMEREYGELVVKYIADLETIESLKIKGKKKQKTYNPKKCPEGCFYDCKDCDWIPDKKKRNKK